MKQPYTIIYNSNFTDEQKKTIDNTIEPKYLSSDENILELYADKNIDLIITIGDPDHNIVKKKYPNLWNLPLKDRKSWYNYSNEQEFMQNLNKLPSYFIALAVADIDHSGLVSIFTTSYKSGKFIERPFNTLLKQTYTNWEWVIFDDTDGNDNFENLKTLKNKDRRIRIFKADKNNGIIGNVKNIASSLCRGEFIIEMDHDDELTPNALQLTVEAFKEFPDAGFVYTDCTEIFENKNNFAYGELFSLGYGSYRNELIDGVWRYVHSAAPINERTIRHIVASPNHIRAWRSKTLFELGGWNHRLHVADDYELCIRTFLKTKMIRIPYLCYIQYRNNGGNNFTFIRNAEIQKLVQILSMYYNEKIHNRLIELCDKDTIWNKPDYIQGYKKAWLNSEYEYELNYVSHHNKNLFSYIITVDDDTKEDEINRLIAGGIVQDYPNLEIIVIGMRCSLLQKIMNNFMSPDFKIKWWNLEEGNLIDAKNYACKMVALGEYITYDKIDYTDKTYISRLRKYFDDDRNRIWSNDKKTHNYNVFKKVGYWKQSKDFNLYDEWDKATNNRKIIPLSNNNIDVDVAKKIESLIIEEEKKLKNKK